MARCKLVASIAPRQGPPRCVVMDVHERLREARKYQRDLLATCRRLRAEQSAIEKRMAKNAERIAELLAAGAMD